MECCQVQSYLLPHDHTLTVLLLPLVAAELELWADVLLLQISLPFPFVSTILLPCYCWRVQRVCSRKCQCQILLPTWSMPENFQPFPDCLYPNPPPNFLAWSAWPTIPAAIPSAKSSVPVHRLLVANRPQQTLYMHIPIPETWGIPWPIPLISLVCVQPPSILLSILEILSWQAGNIFTKPFVVLPAGFGKLASSNYFLLVLLLLHIGFCHSVFN